VNAIIKDRMSACKQRLDKRLDKDNFPADLSRPVLGGTGVRFELTGRASGTCYGGLALIRQLVRRLGLAERISEPKQDRLFDDYRYFFYLTNDRRSTAERIVFSANDRCQQENVIAQLNASRALHAPVNDLLSNEAYMLATALAWNLKAWLALSLEEPGSKSESPERSKAHGCSAWSSARS